MLERWERIYRLFFNGLIAAVAVLVLWKLLPVLGDLLVNGGWKPRAAFAVLIGYFATMRLVARTVRFRAFVMYWHTRSLLHIICFKLLFFVLPLAVVFYLAPMHNPGEMLVSIGLLLFLAAVLEWKARPTNS